MTFVQLVTALSITSRLAKLQKEFCDAMGFDVYGARDKAASKKCECTIYNPHYTSSAIRREFGEKSFHYRKRKAA